MFASSFSFGCHRQLSNAFAFTQSTHPLLSHSKKVYLLTFLILLLASAHAFGSSPRPPLGAALCCLMYSAVLTVSDATIHSQATLALHEDLKSGLVGLSTCAAAVTLLSMASWCRIASVEAQTRLVCLTLRREVFVEILGPLEQIMTREKSPQVITQRLLKLQTKGTPTHMPAEVASRSISFALFASFV